MRPKYKYTPLHLTDPNARIVSAAWPKYKDTHLHLTDPNAIIVSVTWPKYKDTLYTSLTLMLG